MKGQAVWNITPCRSVVAEVLEEFAAPAVSVQSSWTVVTNYRLLFTNLHGVVSGKANLWSWPCHWFEKFALMFCFSVPFQKAPFTVINQSIASVLYISYFSCRLSQSLWISLYYGIWGELPKQASKRVGGSFSLSHRQLSSAERNSRTDVNQSTNTMTIIYSNWQPHYNIIFLSRLPGVWSVTV
jgi:hypothetical protein